MSNSLIFAGKMMIYPEEMIIDLIHDLLSFPDEDTLEREKLIAMHIDALFEFTGNCRLSLGRVCVQLEKIVNASVFDMDSLKTEEMEISNAEA